jgi:hypothetical protein
MTDTATAKTVAHYRRPEVRDIVMKFGLPTDCNNAFRAVNGDNGWYIGTKGGVRLRTPEDYDNTVAKYRTLYATLDVMQGDVRTQAQPWDCKKNEPMAPIGTFRECIAYTLGSDIDSIEHDMKKPECKAAVETLAKYEIKRLQEVGIEKSVFCLMSGGEVYVLLHHELLHCPDELAGAERKVFFKTNTSAFKMWLAEIEHDFFKVHPDLVKLVKIDKLTNQKRKFKCVCSVHKKLDLVVVPLDPANLVIDFAKAKLPLSDAVLAECQTWYGSFELGERAALMVPTSTL